MMWMTFAITLNNRRNDATSLHGTLDTPIGVGILNASTRRKCHSDELAGGISSFASSVRGQQRDPSPARDDIITVSRHSTCQLGVLKV